MVPLDEEKFLILMQSNLFISYFTLWLIHNTPDYSFTELSEYKYSFTIWIYNFLYCFINILKYFSARKEPAIYTL